MTTKRERLALFKPLLARNSDLVMAGDRDFATRIAVLAPLRHFAKGLQIDGTSSKEHFRVFIYFTILFDFNTYFHTYVQAFVYRDPVRSGAQPLWLIGDERVVADFIEVVERDALPRLRAITSFGAARAFLEWAPFLAGGGRSPVRFTLLALAEGDFDGARQILAEWPPVIGLYQDLNALGDNLGDRIREKGASLGAGDRALLARILRESEQRRVAKRGLLDIWEKTPFPLEQ